MCMSHVCVQYHNTNSFYTTKDSDKVVLELFRKGFALLYGTLSDEKVLHCVIAVRGEQVFCQNF